MLESVGNQIRGFGQWAWELGGVVLLVDMDHATDIVSLVHDRIALGLWIVSLPYQCRVNVQSCCHFGV
jgi:hypothetical protein